MILYFCPRSGFQQEALTIDRMNNKLFPTGTTFYFYFGLIQGHGSGDDIDFPAIGG